MNHIDFIATDYQIGMNSVVERRIDIAIDGELLRDTLRHFDKSKTLGRKRPSAEKNYRTMDNIEKLDQQYLGSKKSAYLPEIKQRPILEYDLEGELMSNPNQYLYCDIFIHHDFIGWSNFQNSLTKTEDYLELPSFIFLRKQYMQALHKAITTTPLKAA